MAQCKLTPREFISNAFSPQIGAVCSTAADATCQKNNLSFVELLQPFCKLNTEGHFKDPQGNTVTVRNLRLFIQDVNAHPPEESAANKMLNEAVGSVMCEHTTSIRIGTTELDIPVSVPWFEAWREMFLSVQFPSDHEFTKHFLACMIVVSTAEDNPLEKIQNMGAQLHLSIPGKLPKWFNNNTLRYYILVHDTVQDDRNKAEIVFTEMKNIYGANNCFLLQMNSRPPGQIDDNTHLPDPWSQFLAKPSDTSVSSGQSSSPRTPADIGGVSSMPSEVITDTEKTSQAGTPIAPQSSVLLSPDENSTVSFSSGVSESVNTHLEVGQEAVSVTVHPLSPTVEDTESLSSVVHTKGQAVSDTPINVNVWADSPSYVTTQHGARLSTQDLERLRTLITEFCLKSLLPYVEKQIGLLNDVISNKKGVSRSLFSATRRWFGTNKPGIPGPTPSNAVIYTTESPELQLRRLGDLCFMFGHYSLAYQAYHSAKRDFAADQAWLYYAGALEMAALSAFMQGETNRKTLEYMDDAILTYLNSCKMPQFATRATLLSAECLKGRGLYGEAAKQLIRMTSEKSDLRSALLLEQAAYCFIGPKMMRKYAFHAVLAGHRFSKAGQKRHSLRCYQQAYQVYDGRGWSLAEDHIHSTIGTQAALLKQVGEAVKAFVKLLNAYSKQGAPQQAKFLHDFLNVHNLLLQEGLSNGHELPTLPLPLVNSDNIKVLYGPIAKPYENKIPASHLSFNTEDCDDVRWYKMEEMLITEAQGSPPMIMKPLVALYSKISNNTVKANAVLDEPVHFCIELYNPLHIPLPLSNITLLWLFTSADGQVTNEIKLLESLKPIEAQIIETIILQPTCGQHITLYLVPKQVGELKVLGLSYDLSNPTIAVSGKRLFEIRGPKLKNVKEKPGTNMYGVDYRLEMNVIEKAPCLQVYFSNLTSKILCGEIQKVDVTLRNVGNAPLTNVYLASTDAKLFSLGEEYVNTQEYATKKSNKLITKIPLPFDTNTLNVGESCTIPLWMRAPHEKGDHRLDLLFYYENIDSKSTIKYRLCRHTWHFTVLDSVQISAIATRSVLFKDVSPTLNLIVCVKNASHVHDSITNEIVLSKVLFQSDTWSVFSSSVLSIEIKIQPQEMFHLMLKLRKKSEGESVFSDVFLTQEPDSAASNAQNYPYISFIQRRHIPSLDVNENSIDTQQPFQRSLQNAEQPFLSAAVTLNSTLILKWQARAVEGGVVTRHVIGQHHLDLEYLNKTYKHPKEIQLEPNEYEGRLKIFGPDRNVPDSSTVTNKEQTLETEFLKNIISFSLSHARQISHNFDQNRLCFVPVIMYIQNHLESQIDVKVSTIGTSSGTHLPNIKSQVYSPQASTFYRYACHSAISSHIEPLASSTVKLQAVLPASGTYDLAARVEVSVRVVNTREFILQKWKMESICIINGDSK
ncbi:PREDICTED: trafficking protein particle complex subunit 8 [Dufourea novaeangliae]|uniref:Trafficking protein particle complex subunit 8 n=1 Tax=Dufourea novaeangliae TaxID=178035 RepID=A0A154P334_DUFNO|nr:PREDICTED: trafficking protein particle complex subunit 8 [Dufourea novaeangliae]KZC06243.1 Trafficking protein particle complex subunit 8 [Dufourea novaeangliae]